METIIQTDEEFLKDCKACPRSIYGSLRFVYGLALHSTVKLQAVRSKEAPHK